MKTITHTLQTALGTLLLSTALWACSNNHPAPENTPTPLPSPEERPVNHAPVEGASQPIDTVHTLPKE